MSYGSHGVTTPPCCCCMEEKQIRDTLVRIALHGVGVLVDSESALNSGMGQSMGLQQFGT